MPKPRMSSGISQLVSVELCRRPDDGAALDVAQELIQSNSGKLLYKAIVKRLSHAGAEPGSDTVTKLLTLFETMMEANAGVAAYLMARLYARASARRDTATQHAVELWMNGLATDEAARALTVLIHEPLRPAHRRRCMQWADGIRRRAKLVEY